MRLTALTLSFALISTLGANAAQRSRSHVTTPLTKATEVAFAPNLGQFDESIHFVAHGAVLGITLGVHGLSLVIPPNDESPGSHRGEFVPDIPPRVVIRFAGGRLGASRNTEDRLRTVNHYLTGSDRSRWRRNVPTYRRVTYDAVYQGIDVAFYGRGSHLEYDFIVSAGADPGEIELEFSGAEPRLAASGTLSIATGNLVFSQSVPAAYQNIGGRRTPVESRYVMRPNGHVGFEVGAYDPNVPLVIDPMLVYSVPLDATAIAADDDGNAYTVGTDYAGNQNIVIRIVDGQGGLVSQTFYGLDQRDWGNGIARDTSGALYVVGYSELAGVPPWHYGVFAKFDATAVNLVCDRTLDGERNDGINAVAVDDAGRAYMTGMTSSYTFPVTGNAFQPMNASPVGSGIAFFTVLEPNCGDLTYSTYLGGSQHVWSSYTDDQGIGVAIDGMGHGLVAGFAGSRDFPTTPGTIKTVHDQTEYDAFLAKFDITASGTDSLVYSTLLGGTSGDEAYSVAADEEGNAYVTGKPSPDFFPPGTPGAEPVYGGNGDPFIAKVNPLGTAYVYGTYFGGSAQDGSRGIAVDMERSIYVAGSRRYSPPDPPGVDPWYVKLDPTGMTFWDFELLTHENGYGMAIAVRPAGTSIHLTGQVTARWITPPAPVVILPETTRWKPQRSDDLLTIVFTAPDDINLDSGVLEITPPIGPRIIFPCTAPCSITRPLPDGPFNIAWTGPWTYLDPNGIQGRLPAGELHRGRSRDPWCTAECGDAQERSLQQGESRRSRKAGVLSAHRRR